MRFQGLVAAMGPASPYCLESAIMEFFALTTVSREDCDKKALELVGGEVIPVTIQGNCSYSVYAGSNSEFVVHFRPAYLALRTETTSLARKIHGTLVPHVSFDSQLGKSAEKPLLAYVLPRILGITYLDFIRQNYTRENSQQNFLNRKTLIRDVARYVFSMVLLRDKA
jgi:hypothetical protein